MKVKANGKLPALVSGGFDWVDVRDVITGTMRAEERAPAGAKYILSGHWASLCDVAMSVEQITGVSAPSFVCPMWLPASWANDLLIASHCQSRLPSQFYQAQLI